MYRDEHYQQQKAGSGAWEEIRGNAMHRGVYTE